LKIIQIADKSPNNSWNKNEIILWLENHGTVVDRSYLKWELLQMVRKLNIKKSYIVDGLLKSHGHKVLRLAQYHCELNPIEKVWAEMKKYVESNNKFTETSIESIEKLIHDSFKNLKPGLWESCCKHISEVEEEFWRSDGLMDGIIDEFIIDFNSDSDTESDSSD